MVRRKRTLVLGRVRGVGRTGVLSVVLGLVFLGDVDGLFAMSLCGGSYVYGVVII